MTNSKKDESGLHDAVTEAVEAVRAWHNALNQTDVAQMVRCVSSNVVLAGPRGNMTGADALREWVGRANIRLHPHRYFGRAIDHAVNVVVEEQAAWRDAGSGQVVGEQKVASLFVVANGLITHIARYDALDTALAEAGLTHSDRIG